MRRPSDGKLPAFLIRHARAIILALGVLGLATSAWLAMSVYRDGLKIEHLHFEAEVDEHIALLRTHVTARETLARAVAATFRAPEALGPGALRDIDPAMFSLVPDIFSFVWVPRVAPAEVPQALAALAGAGVPRETLLGPGGAPRPPSAAIAFPVLDIEPKSEANLRSLGLDLGSLPLPRAALDAAMRDGAPAATAPLELVQQPGIAAFVLYVPVRGRAAGEAPGFLGFSYRYDRLIGAALADTPSAPRRFVVRDGTVQVYSRGAPAGGEPPAIEQRLEFGGRSWSVAYWPNGDLAAGPSWRAVATGVTTAAIFALALLFIGGLAAAGRRLQAAVLGQAEAEARLRTVIEELNHRAKNMLAMVQAVVQRTFRDGGDPSQLRQRLEGRLGAMAGATTVLSLAEWRGARFSELVTAAGLPFDARVERGGDDPMIAPVAAQSLVLLLHELWTNATKHGALSVREGRVVIGCSVTDGRFRFAWSELGGPPFVPPTRRGFGRQLIERIVPGGLDGEATLGGGPDGLRYHLDAPAERVVGDAPLLPR